LLRVVLQVARKEVQEYLRDRMTVVLTILIPLVLYPAVLLLGTQFIRMSEQTVREQPSRIALVGDDEVLLPRMERLESEPALWRAVALDAHPAAGLEGEAARQTLDAWFRDHELSTDLLVDLTGVPADDDDAMASSEVVVWYRSTSDRSRLALDRWQEEQTRWGQGLLEARLVRHQLEPGFALPLSTRRVDLSDASDRGSSTLAIVLPLLLVLNLLTWSLQPAMELTTGERERGTILTLLTAPVPSWVLVCGKWLAVQCLTLFSGALNLLSLGLLLVHGLHLFPEIAEDFQLPTGGGVWLHAGIAVLALVLTFASATLAAGCAAPSRKDAEPYTAPLILLAFVVSGLVHLPGMEMSWALALTPLFGPTLLLRSALVTGVPWSLSLVTLLGSVGWSVALVALSTRLFASERSREGGLARWWSEGRRSAGGPPDAFGAGAWFVFTLALLYYGGTLLQAWSPQWGLLATLWGLFLLPTLGFARLRGWSLGQTFAWRPAQPGWWLLAAVLGVAGPLWMASAMQGLIGWLAPVSEASRAEALEMLQAYFPRPASAAGWLWLLFLAAVSPAVCEEHLCRGLLLQGLRREWSAGWAVLLSALAFGILHLSLERLPATTLLGLVLGWITLRSGSIGPAILLHAVHNGTTLVVGYTAGAWLEAPPAWFGVMSFLTWAGALWAVQAMPQAEGAAARVSSVAPHS
jgi:sodium transport system permease protein